jgi:profilin
VSEGWQQYLDLVLQDQQVRVAGLYGQDGTLWAASDDLKLPATEVKDLIAGIRDNASFQQNGVIIAGAKYMFVHDYSDYDAPTVTGFIAKKGPTFAVGVMTGKTLTVVLTADGVTGLGEIQGLHFLTKQLLARGF